MKPGTPSFTSTRLLDQLRERIGYLHYSLQTEKAYLYWVRFFIRWHGRAGVMRHPREMGSAEIEAFLNMLANERRISSSTHNQALRAILFLYREVLAVDLPWLNGLNRPAQKKRIPSVPTRKEVAALFSFLEGEMALLAKLLYGTGMRLMEGLRLRIKDVDFDRRVIVVRDGKGGKDRVVMLPRSLAADLKTQTLFARSVWDADAKAQRGGVETPHALEKKYPRVGHTWGWFWVFPSPTSRWTRVRVSSDAITCLKSVCSAPSKRHPPRRASPNKSPSTPCAIPLPRTCCRRAPTSARCRNCWAIRTCPPP